MLNMNEFNIKSFNDFLNKKIIIFIQHILIQWDISEYSNIVP